MTPDAQLLDALCGLARAAGREVMSVYATDFRATAKEDKSPLTEADLRADAVIRSGLAAAYPLWPVISEESLPAAAPPDVGPFFLVDPLDGTKEFVARTGEFTINIALVDGERPVAGVVFAPAVDQLYAAADGLGAYRESAGLRAPIHVAALGAGRPLRIVGSRTHGGARLASWVDGLPLPREFAPSGSSLKFCRIAEGAADLYPRLGPTSLWDTAAAQCVLEQAGGHVTDFRGQPLRYRPHPPWLNPEFVAWADPACFTLCASLVGLPRVA